MSETAPLEITAMCAGYGSVEVVRGVTMTVRSGEVVALLGPNGAGKTTTLRAVSGLIARQRGEIRVLGRPQHRVAPHQLARSGLAHLPEGRGVFFGLTVADHFKLGHRGERRLDFERAVELFPELSRLRERLAGQLSGGEQQMLALARTMARSPRLLLIDELSLGLAPVIVERLLPVVRQYATSSGAGVLLVEQHVDLALGIADRAYVLVHGAVALSEPAALLRENRDLVTRAYLGSSGST